MSADKNRTIDSIKQKHQVPEEAKKRRKVYADMRKALRNALEEAPKTIPELATETGISIDDVTYYLMTLRKYGDVVTGEIDDDDEFFYYELKKSS
jgi:predicted Rossmann fold nucleotide-binding protein DprA/Smf involved in DNA uptake